MAKSKPTLRSRKTSRKDRPTVTSSVAAGRECAPLRSSTQVTPTRFLRRRVNGRFTAQDPPPSFTFYQYTPLNKDSDEIRLLTLHEGDFTAGVQVSIHTVPLTPENPPIYEALSYVWGSTENLTDIKVGNDCLAVTRNLANALPYLRYKDKPRTLWIDAICVNQQDSKERGHQVKRMADLYRLADRVVVWLGPEKNHSGWGMRILDQLSSQIEVDKSTRGMKPASKEAEPHWSDDRIIVPYSYGELLAINEVLSRPWFERLWIQQEIRCANRNAIILCGGDMIAWQSLGRATFCLTRKMLSRRSLNEDLTGLLDRVHMVSSLADGIQEYTLREIMYNTRHCTCFDPRDRIYAVLSLLREYDKAIGIEIDYKKRTSQVYQDLALRYIAHHELLHPLTSSGLRDKPSDMPTWVPDWTFVNISWGLASGNSVSKVSYRGADILSVTGTLVATVQHAERRKRFKDTKSMIPEIRRIAPYQVLRRSYVGGGSLLAAYCCTICASDFCDMHLPPRRDRPQFRQSKDFLSAVLQPAENQIPDHSPGTEAYNFLIAENFYSAERSFVETREGYIGLAPQTAQPGDQVCILLGCDKPMLLRPASNFQYQVIGECYIHGLMQGEALLGPLPGYYQVVEIWEERYSGFCHGFLDHQTGKAQYRDPRFEAPLENDDGDQYRAWKHPDGSCSRRLTAKMLEKRGVSLQTFDLI